MSPDSIGAGPPRSGSQCLPPASAAVFPSPPDSTPHICPELSRQRFCPYSPPPLLPEPANKGQIPATQMLSPQERFTCSAQGMQNILSAQRTSGRQLCPQQTSGGTVPPACSDAAAAAAALESPRGPVFTQRTLVLYTEAAHTCACV